MKMNVLILITLLLRVMSAMSDQQCDCSALAFIKQLVQQEMFERKLEISMLRSEMRKVSTVPRLLETTNSMEDVHTRVEKLEQRFSMLENASDIGQQEDAGSRGQSGNRKSSDRNEENVSFQILVKQALSSEKLERMKFNSHVQSQIENLNTLMSDFTTSTDIFVNEQARNWSAEYEQFEKNISQKFSDFRESLELSLKEHANKTASDIEIIKEGMHQVEQNASRKMEDFSLSVTSNLKESEQQTKSVINEIIDNVTDVKEGVNECTTAMGSLKVYMNDSKIAVDGISHTVADLYGQLEEHLKGAERRFSSIAKTVGTCGGVGGVNQWKRHGNKCYHYSAEAKSWFIASETCRKLNGGLVEIRSKEENDHITADIMKRSSAFWIGLHDSQLENEWQWNSDEGASKFGDFRNWAPNEPNNANANEDCTTILPNGMWNDFTCSESLPYICERLLFI